MYWVTLSTAPFSAIQASFRFRCFLSSCLVTSRGFPFTMGPPTPLRSFPDLVSLTQSIREQPGARATLFLGFPVAEPANCGELGRGNRPEPGPALSGLLI